VDDDSPPCECDWCDVVSDVEASLSAIADGDAAWWVDIKGSAYWCFSPPEGPDVAHWASTIADDRDTCLIAQEQDD
jgi:hypothetical protein